MDSPESQLYVARVYEKQSLKTIWIYYSAIAEFTV